MSKVRIHLQNGTSFEVPETALNSQYKHNGPKIKYVEHVGAVMEPPSSLPSVWETMNLQELQTKAEELGIAKNRWSRRKEDSLRNFLIEYTANQQ